MKRFLDSAADRATMVGGCPVTPSVEGDVLRGLMVNPHVVVQWKDAYMSIQRVADRLAGRGMFG